MTPFLQKIINIIKKHNSANSSDYPHTQLSIEMLEDLYALSRGIFIDKSSLNLGIQNLLTQNGLSRISVVEGKFLLKYINNANSCFLPIDPVMSDLFVLGMIYSFIEAGKSGVYRDLAYEDSFFRGSAKVVISEWRYFLSKNFTGTSDEIIQKYQQDAKTNNHNNYAVDMVILYLKYALTYPALILINRLKETEEYQRFCNESEEFLNYAKKVYRFISSVQDGSSDISKNPLNLLTILPIKSQTASHKEAYRYKLMQILTESPSSKPLMQRHLYSSSSFKDSRKRKQTSPPSESSSVQEQDEPGNTSIQKRLKTKHSTSKKTEPIRLGYSLRNRGNIKKPSRYR